MSTSSPSSPPEPCCGATSSCAETGADDARLDAAVHACYSAAAARPDPQLCSPVDYDPRLLAAIPAEVIARDYGCGNPTRFVRPGETVLDLGSGAGKACFLAAQVVGPAGRVIGVDSNDDMLALARGAAPVVAQRLGYANVAFHKARIEDLALQREAVDVVISNCVLNLVLPSAKRRLFGEIFRVLRPGGRAVISDIVSDADVPERLQRDPALWTGCVSGAFREDAFLFAFAQAGFRGIELLARAERPWQVLEGIAFRSVTVQACKGPPDAGAQAALPAASASCCEPGSCC